MSERLDEMRRRLIALAASAQDAQDHLADLEELGPRLDDMQDDLERLFMLAQSAP